jgi:rRNA processing protein Gar1
MMVLQVFKQVKTISRDMSEEYVYLISKAGKREVRRQSSFVGYLKDLFGAIDDGYGLDKLYMVPEELGDQTADILDNFSTIERAEREMRKLMKNHVP